MSKTTNATPVTPKTKAEIIAENKKALDAKLKTADDLAKNKSTSREAMDKAIAELETAEQTYAQSVVTDLYDNTAKLANPIVEILKAFTYQVFGHKFEYDETKKHIIGVTQKAVLKQVNLKDFCERAKLDTLWLYRVYKLNKLMTVRTARNLGISEEECAVINNDYQISEIADAVNLGETPTSNTQLCKNLQAVFDAVLPKDKGGKPQYKVTVHDVAYLEYVFCQRFVNKKIDAKLAHTTYAKVPKDSYFLACIADVGHNLVTNGSYGIIGGNLKSKKG